MLRELIRGWFFGCGFSRLRPLVGWFLAFGFVAGSSLVVSSFAPGVFVVIDRVSVPYSVELPTGALAAGLALAFVGGIGFLAEFRAFVRAVARAVLVFGAFVAVAELIGFRAVGLVGLSVYMAGLPLAKYFLVGAGLAAAYVALHLATKFGGEWLRGKLSFIPSGKGGVLGLGEAMFLWAAAFTFLLIPYLPWVNPEAKLVDVDQVFYLKWLGQTHWGNLANQIFSFTSGDRPLFMLVLFLVTRAVPFNVLDFFYVAGFSALATVLAEGIARSLGVRRYVGFVAFLLASVPAYFVFGGYHANLAALVLSYLGLYAILALGDRGAKILPWVSLTAVLTHSEAWMLHTAFFVKDRRTLMSWVLPGGAYLLVRYLFIAPAFPAKLTASLFFSGTPTIENIDFQLLIMLWGVPATWVTYALVAAGVLKLLGEGSIHELAPAIASTALIAPLILVPTSRFLVHRVIMNTLYWVPVAWLLSKDLRRGGFLTSVFIGMQSAYVVWLLTNAA